MTDDNDTHQQQRSRDRESSSRKRSGFFSKLKNPRTLRLVFGMGLWTYRLVRLGLRVLEFFD